jgi:hypothetical protein
MKKYNNPSRKLTYNETKEILRMLQGKMQNQGCYAVAKSITTVMLELNKVKDVDAYSGKK